MPALPRALSIPVGAYCLARGMSLRLSTASVGSKGAGRVRMFSDGTGGVVWNWITGEAALWFDDAGRRSQKPNGIH